MTNQLYEDENFFKIFLTLNMWLCSSAGTCLEWARIRSDSEFFFQAFFLHFLYCISFVKIIASPPKKNVKNNFTNLQTCRGEGQPLAQMFSTVMPYVSQGF